MAVLFVLSRIGVRYNISLAVILNSNKRFNVSCKGFSTSKDNVPLRIFQKIR
jgi:hypothetical protein